jgi:hypothetical protein
VAQKRKRRKRKKKKRMRKTDGEAEEVLEQSCWKKKGRRKMMVVA